MVEEMNNETREIFERLVRIETLLQSDMKALEERITKLESSNTWLVRTVIGIIITAIMGLVITTTGVNAMGLF